MLGLILSRLRQQNSNWNALSVKQLLSPLFALYLKKTNSITVLLIIINNGVCAHVCTPTDVIGLSHTHTHTCTHTHHNERQHSDSNWVCVTAGNVCASTSSTYTYAVGCIYSPFFHCCHDSPVSHRPERRVAQVKNPLSATPLRHNAAAGRCRNLIIKRKLVTLAWQPRGVG